MLLSESRRGRYLTIYCQFQAPCYMHGMLLVEENLYYFSLLYNTMHLAFSITIIIISSKKFSTCNYPQAFTEEWKLAYNF